MLFVIFTLFQTKSLRHVILNILLGLFDHVSLKILLLNVFTTFFVLLFELIFSVFLHELAEEEFSLFSIIIKGLLSFLKIELELLLFVV